MLLPFLSSSSGNTFKVAVIYIFRGLKFEIKMWTNVKRVTHNDDLQQIITRLSSYDLSAHQSSKTQHSKVSDYPVNMAEEIAIAATKPHIW